MLYGEAAMRNRAERLDAALRRQENPTGQPEVAGLLAMRQLLGNAATRRAVEEPLDPTVRTRLEGQFGAELSQVRIRRDAAATAQAGGIAYTVGNSITVDPNRYHEGTPSGDALIAHEVAHTLQQQGGGSAASDAALEAEADRAALSTVMDRPRFFPTLRSALSLRRCKGCTPEEEQWLNSFRAEQDPERLAEMLRPRTDDQLTRLSQADGGDSVHTEAVTWERAVRAREFGRLSGLSASANPGLRTAYGRRVVGTIMAGGLSIRITGGDERFRSFVEGALNDLAGTPSGVRLIFDLLNTARPVTLEPAAPGGGHETNPASTAGRLTTLGPQPSDPNVPPPVLPPGQQTRGGGSGSSIKLDQNAAANQVVLGGSVEHPAIIDMNGTVTVGHELIHALHNAMGVNLSDGRPRELSQLIDPVTGQQMNPEELYTITGRTRFSPIPGIAPADMSQPTEYNAPATVTENDLRRDLGLPPRSSHAGATDTIRVLRGSSTTVDALLARYRVRNGAVPPDGVAVIRSMLNPAITDEALAHSPADFPIFLPHPDHIMMRVKFVDRNTRLAGQLLELTVQ
jgi:hypothetical protein